jgi:ABC-type uncharacterized transport system substrate-binding protein
MRRPAPSVLTRTRRVIVLALVIGAMITPPAADAQSARKTALVGVLGIGPNSPGNRAMFVKGLAEHGYAEGRQVAFVEHHAGDDPARVADAASALLRARPDVIFVRGPAATAAAAHATTTVPIVAVDLESDPVAMRFAKTLARPGGNVTGVFMDLPEMSAKQLQLLREIAPGLSRVALLGDLKGNAAQFQATARAAQSFGVQVESLDVRTPADLDSAMEAARRRGAGAVIIFSSPVVFRYSVRLADLARDKRLPSVSLFTPFAEAGGLLSYGPNLGEAFRRCGNYVARVLGGAKPAELPIERPERFELVINLRTARLLGLTVPPSLLARAEQIIE